MAVNKYKSFTVVAERLHKTQSAVSAQIALLEERANLKLLDRSHRPYQLTEAGRRFLEFAEVTVNRAEGLERTFQELANGRAGEIKIGASTSIATHVLPEIVIGILKQYPNLRFTLLTRSPRIVSEAVRQCEVDFAVVQLHQAPRGLTSKLLKTQRLCFITSSSHPLLRKKVIVAKDLQNIPFVAGLKNSEYDETVNEVLGGIGLHAYCVALRMNSFAAMKEYVRSGLGVTIVPEWEVKHEIKAGVFSEIKIKNVQPTSKIMMVENPRIQSSPSMTLVKELIEKRLLKVL